MSWMWHELGDIEDFNVMYNRLFAQSIFQELIIVSHFVNNETIYVFFIFFIIESYIFVL